MRKNWRPVLGLLCGVSIGSVATTAYAQDNQDADDDAPVLAQNSYDSTIVVTAQRQSQRLQDVPIAVSAFSSENLEAQQIENSSDLQLTLPNVTFTKSNFTGSSFTIRGIGDLCVGVSCDSATAIHQNESPLFATRLFETEYFDLERIEVLRGPQGTLFGRNATSGVVNIVTAKPDLTGFSGAIEGEFGNYESYKVKGHLNLPIGETLGARIAGFYLNRDGYTRNLFDGDRIDDRDIYAFRGSLRWEPGPDTTLDLVGYYFREKDNRLRNQKQYCQRDPTGVLGCLNNRRDASATNGNSTFVGTLTSEEFLRSQGIPDSFALGSLYGPDAFQGTLVPDDPRVVNTEYTPQYFASEHIFQGKLDHNFGAISASLSGTYQLVKVDSSQDYNLATQNRALFAPGLNTLAFFAANGIPIQDPNTGAITGFVPGSAAYFAPIANAIIPGGPNGQLCTSAPEETGLGSFGGFSNCGDTPLSYDRSNQRTESWSAEAIISSDFDGMFNFLIGGIYSELELTENSYYVNSFGIDYLAGVLGSFTSFSNGLPPSFLGTPFFRNNTDNLKVESYGIYGEAYVEFSDSLKLTLGARYNNDKKAINARSTLASFLVPYNQTGSAFDSPFGANYDADPATVPGPGLTCGDDVSPVGAVGSVPACEAFQFRQVGFDKVTGRAVLDWKITPENLLYFSYSRGYKSGGINPPLQPIFAVNEAFGPESVDAFEIGSKNTFSNGQLQLNLTGFYYKYKDLQLSRIVARTSVNDNVDADIYGFEAEAVVRPSPEMLINLGFSYLHTEVSSDRFLPNPRDPGGGRSDAVIIKDITNGSNCAVVPTTAGNAAGSNGFVNQVNQLINAGAIPGLAAGAGLQDTTSFPADGGIASTGAFSVCGALDALAPTVGAAFGGVSVELAGVPVNIRGNELPQAPNYKFSAGAQYTIDFANGMTLVPRADLSYTGDHFGNIFNGKVNKVNGYAQVNAQMQLNGQDNRWFVRAFVQNLFDSNSETGLYVTDQSSGLFTNVFTLDPRRYGIAAGFKF